ncbi:MAG: hypothetical protein K6F33_12100 [Bacteroidales bacterium]|nr:hypothetical protein [Bacteroidales bacterium]
MAPYIGLISSMSEREKVAVVQYIINLIPKKKDDNQQSDIQRESEISEQELNVLREKIKQLPCNSKTKRLLELRHDAAKYIDLSDEKTRYLLGL